MSTKSVHYYFNNLAPEKITAGRELRKMTKTALADQIGKSASAISQFESGKSGLDFETFLNIIDALSLPAAYFCRNRDTEAVGYSMAHCHFRAKRNVSQLERYQSSRYAEMVISIYNALSNLGIRFPSPCIPIFEKSSTSLSEPQVEKIAESARTFWKLGNGPIKNMASFVETVGVRVILLPEDSKNIDGFSTWVGEQPYIMVVGNSVASRLQFDYAHELAHILLHTEDVPGELDTERVANRFAGAFLMPYSSFAVEAPHSWRGIRGMLNIKERWRVSMSAALFRARQVGIMRESAYRWAMIKISESGQRKEEKGEFEKPVPSLLQQGIALIAEEVTLEELAESACMSSEMLEAILIEQGVSIDTINLLRPHVLPKKATVIRFPHSKE